MQIIETYMHKDLNHVENWKTALFYLNTNDGYTKFESGEIVETVANRLVIFDGRYTNIVELRIQMKNCIKL